VKVRLVVELVAVRLDRDDTAGYRFLVSRGFAEELLQGLVEALAKEAKKLAVVFEIDPEQLGDRDDVLAVGYTGEDLLSPTIAGCRLSESIVGSHRPLG
jgi:hypothetical protein